MRACVSSAFLQLTLRKAEGYPYIASIQQSRCVRQTKRLAVAEQQRCIGTCSDCNQDMLSAVSQQTS
jgi:hypothetical protein